MKYLLFLFLLSSLNCFSQETEISEAAQFEDTIIALPVVAPEFPGGVRKMVEFIQNNFNHPICSVGNEVTGIIWISCVIEKNGSLTNLKIEKGLHEVFDEEAMRVIKSMPKWKPGEDESGNVKRMKYYIPIKIK